MSTDPYQYKRPESVLVVVYTSDLDVLLLRRVQPFDFWQSITGGLNWPDECAADAARRELAEETAIRAGDGWVDWQTTETFEIHPKWTARYGPGVTRNREHLFSLKLPSRCEVTIEPAEHVDYRWESLKHAAESVWSWTNKKALTRIAKSEGLEITG